jgi:hypothetical protein
MMRKFAAFAAIWPNGDGCCKRQLMPEGLFSHSAAHFGWNQLLGQWA